MKKLRNLIIPMSFALATLVPSKETVAEPRLSFRMGTNLPVEQYERNFSPGFAAAMDYKNVSEDGILSLDLGASLYEGNGDHREDVTNRIFSDPDKDTFDERFFEASIHGGPMINIGSIHIGAGLRQNFVFGRKKEVDEEEEKEEQEEEGDENMGDENERDSEGDDETEGEGEDSVITGEVISNDFFDYIYGIFQHF